jgi:hypothetical protein
MRGQALPCAGLCAGFRGNGYNRSFGKASAFYIEAPLPSGFLLNCGASKSPNSQRFQCPNNTEPSQALFHFPSSTFPTVPTQGSTAQPLAKAWRSETEHRWLACKPFISLFIKPGHIPGAEFMNIDNTHIAVGKYLVSPLAKPQGEGLYAASVSIRSGQGSATHDRVMRFSGLFDSAAAAVHYATEHALGWIHERSCPACA